MNNKRNNRTNTRKEAIETGVLIDVSTYAREVDLMVPTAISKNLWDDINKIPAHSDHTADRRLRKIIFEADYDTWKAVNYGSGSTMIYGVPMEIGESCCCLVKFVVRSGDDGERVITLMRPDEEL